MRWLDRVLQNARINKAKRFIKPHSVILDIGSDNGVLFKKIKNLKYGIGIEPNLENEIIGENYKILKGFFPAVCPHDIKFDTITLLAVLEHIPTIKQVNLAKCSYEVLNLNGNIIITVPSPKVDIILAILRKLRLIDGMSLEEHYGFKVSDTLKIFAPPYFQLMSQESFQLGLNNIFVFRKINGQPEL